MALTQQAISALKAKPAILIQLGEANEKNWQTIYKWVLGNNEKLTMAKNLQIIREETGLSDAEILEPLSTPA